MRKLALSLGSGRQAAAWRPASMTVDEIWERIKKPIRTSETNEQYWQMTRNEREAVKDKGAFVGGTLKGTRRKKEEVVSRSMVTMDYDKLTPDFFDGYEKSHRFHGGCATH